MYTVIKFADENIEIKDSIAIPFKEKEKLLDDVTEEIIKEYQSNDCEIYDILDSVCVNNLSISDVVRVYAKAYNRIEEDKVVRFYSEGGYLDLATGSQFLEIGGR